VAQPATPPVAQADSHERARSKRDPLSSESLPILSQVAGCGQEPGRRGAGSGCQASFACTLLCLLLDSMRDLCYHWLAVCPGAASHRLLRPPPA